MIEDPRTNRFSPMGSMLARITYKPGWSLRLRHGLKYVTLEILFTTPDSCEKGRETIIGRGTLLPDIWSYRPPTIEEFARFVYNAISVLEAHELSEWLKVDNKHVVEPHPELNGPDVVLPPLRTVTDVELQYAAQMLDKHVTWEGE